VKLTPHRIFLSWVPWWYSWRGHTFRRSSGQLHFRQSPGHVKASCKTLVKLRPEIRARSTILETHCPIPSDWLLDIPSLVWNKRNNYFLDNIKCKRNFVYYGQVNIKLKKLAHNILNCYIFMLKFCFMQGFTIYL